MNPGYCFGGAAVDIERAYTASNDRLDRRARIPGWEEKKVFARLELANRRAAFAEFRKDRSEMVRKCRSCGKPTVYDRMFCGL